MEDKNRELNAEELEQAAGGAGGMSVSEARHFILARGWGKNYKYDGHTLEEFLNDYNSHLTTKEKQQFSIEWSRW